jgi:hypothetical protein
LTTTTASKFFAFCSWVKIFVNYEYVICRQESDLPFYDVIFAQGLPKAASLPVATSQLVRTRIMNGTYDFDYVYFTESDQVRF